MEFKLNMMSICRNQYLENYNRYLNYSLFPYITYFLEYFLHLLLEEEENFLKFLKKTYMRKSRNKFAIYHKFCVFGRHR